MASAETRAPDSGARARRPPTAPGSWRACCLASPLGTSLLAKLAHAPFGKVLAFRSVDKAAVGSKWEAEAENWVRWARTPGFDAYWYYSPSFLDRKSVV